MTKHSSQKLEKNINLIYEVTANVQFGHVLVNSEFGIMKLPHMSILVTP
jgi:hypothetical protein